MSTRYTPGVFRVSLGTKVREPFSLQDRCGPSVWTFYSRPGRRHEWVDQGLDPPGSDRETAPESRRLFAVTRGGLSVWFPSPRKVRSPHVPSGPRGALRPGTRLSGEAHGGPTHVVPLAETPSVTAGTALSCLVPVSVRPLAGEATEGTS